MVAIYYLCLVALLLTTSNVNALNAELDSELEDRGTQTRQQVFQRAKRRRGLKKGGVDAVTDGKGKGTPRPTPMPTPDPTPMPTPGPTPMPTPGPTPEPSGAPSTAPSSSPSARPSESPSSSPSESPSSAPIIPDVFASYIRLEVATVGGVEVDLEVIDDLAALTIETYNNEVQKCADPFGRRMTSATFFYQRPVTPADEGRMRRKTKVVKGDHSERKLQSLNIYLFLRINGQCNGCNSNPFFFNQVVGRRLQDGTCTIPPVEDFLGGINDGLMTRNFGNINNAQSVKDVLEPSTAVKKTKKGKGKGA